MLTQADDFPVHQTPEPIAVTDSNRNFYDRYWFHGYVDEADLYFGLAFGMYPNIDLKDAHFAVRYHGMEYCVHASEYLRSERLNMSVGPIRVIVEEPLRRLRVTVSAENGIAADINFEARSGPIKEPRFTQRHGPRLITDFTRLTQNGRYTGWVSVDGVRTVFSDAFGTRDRSWGIRALGAPDPQPFVPPRTRQLFWRWVPLNFADQSIFFHVGADESGMPWNTHIQIVPDASDAAAISAGAVLDTPMLAGTRHARSGTLDITYADGRKGRVALEPLGEPFFMRGVGYLTPGWGHGTFKGERVVEREDLQIASLNPADPANAHIQLPVRATLHLDGAQEEGIGSLEQLIAGVYLPYGLNRADSLIV